MIKGHKMVVPATQALRTFGGNLSATQAKQGESQKHSNGKRAAYYKVMVRTLKEVARRPATY